MKMLVVTITITLLLTATCIAIMNKKSKTDTVTATDLSRFPNALYPVSIKGKWGYMNNKLQIVIDPQFERAEDFHDGMAAVSKTFSVGENESKELWGFIDSTGRLSVPYKYERVTYFREGLAAVGKNELFGYIDNTGKEVISLQYEEASVFFEGLAAVKINGKTGFINQSNDVVIQPQFARATWVSDFSNGLAAVYESMDDGAGGYIDKTGKLVIPMQYSFVGRFHEGLAIVQPVGSNYYGYINKEGKMVIPAKYSQGLHFSEGVATVQVTEPNGKSYYEIIDKNGKTLASHLPYDFAGIFREGLAGVETHNQRWGFIDKTGKEVIAPRFAGVNLFRNGLSRMETGHLFNGLQTVYIDHTGKVVWQEKTSKQ